MRSLFTKPDPGFCRLKLVYSYVIEVADSEYQLYLHHKALVSEISLYYHPLEYARGRPGRRGHVHLGQNFSIQILFSKLFLTFLGLLGS